MHIAALDGWLCHILVLKVYEVGRVIKLYQCYGLNIEAILHCYLFCILDVLLIARHFIPHENRTLVRPSWCLLCCWIRPKFYQAILLFHVVKIRRALPKMHVEFLSISLFFLRSSACSTIKISKVMP